MPGYTHLKQAEPVTFGHWCLAYAEMGEVTKAEEAVKKVEKHLPLVAAMLTEALAQQLDDGPAHLPAQSLAKKFTFVSP